MKTLIAKVEYVAGHLRSGHYELKLTDDEYREFENMSDEDQESYIKRRGSLIVDDFYNIYFVDDIGPITDTHII